MELRIKRVKFDHEIWVSSPNLLSGQKVSFFSFDGFRISQMSSFVGRDTQSRLRGTFWFTRPSVLTGSFATRERRKCSLFLPQPVLLRCFIMGRDDIFLVKKKHFCGISRSLHLLAHSLPALAFDGPRKPGKRTYPRFQFYSFPWKGHQCIRNEPRAKTPKRPLFPLR